MLRLLQQCTVGHRADLVLMHLLRKMVCLLKFLLPLLSNTLCIHTRNLCRSNQSLGNRPHVLFIHIHVEVDQCLLRGLYIVGPLQILKLQDRRRRCHLALCLIREIGRQIHRVDELRCDGRSIDALEALTDMCLAAADVETRQNLSAGAGVERDLLITRIESG